MSARPPLTLCFIGWGHSTHTEKWLGWYARRGHTVHLITDHPVPMEGVVLHDLGWKPDVRARLARYADLDFNIYWVRVVKTLLRIKALLRTIRPGVLHLHTLYYPSCLGAFTGFHPLVVMPWNGDILWSPQRPWFHRWAVGYALRKADLILTNSQLMTDLVRRRVGISKEIRVRTGVDLERFHPRPRDADLCHALQVDGSPVVLSTRSLGDFYNVDIIVQAIPLVLKEQPDARFVFIWHAGDDLPRHKELIDRLGVEHAVRLCGRVPFDQVPRYFSIADVFLTLSSNDAIPAALLEGMASGVPPVTATLPTVNEWAKDGWNAVVVPQRDVEATARAILRLLRDRRLAQTFVERNLATVREKADFHRRMEEIEERYYALAARPVRREAAPSPDSRRPA